MEKIGKIIAVQGATGQQGNAAARNLLKQGWQVRALTRDVTKPAAKALADLGAQIVRTENDDRASLEAALRGAYGVYAVQNPWLSGDGVQGETRQGKLIADVAKSVHIQHFVYASVGGADRSSGLAHFESKWQIEQHIRSLGLPATVLRPVFFMDNFNWSRPYLLNGAFATIGMRPGRALQMIGVEDIAAFTALALDNPREWAGKALELAGDELTEQQMVEILGRVIGRPVQVTPQQSWGGSDEIRAEQQKSVDWFNGPGYQADIPALRKLYPGLHTFEQWLGLTGWENAPAPDLSKVQAWS